MNLRGGERASGYRLMEKGILLLLLVMVFLNPTFTAVLADDDSTVRVPFCSTRSVKDYIFGFRDQTCPVSGDESAERPHFVVVTEVI